MIEYHYETDFILDSEKDFTDWITRLIEHENADYLRIDYIFCTDDYLLRINQEYLNHDTFTDIITFDYSEGRQVAGDIFISVDRLADNAKEFKVKFQEELLRVMSHGILHLLGYKDKTSTDATLMRSKENEMIALFHVEQ
ncbi:MAG: rRNA maturation RNase YbeY [Saonia sp.]